MRILHCSAALDDESGCFVNLGDEGLSREIQAELRRAMPEHVVTRAIQGRSSTRVGEPTIDARPFRFLLAQALNCDAIVIGGGTLFQHSAGLMRWQVLLALVGRIQRKPVCISHIGAEGLRGWSAGVARFLVSSASSVTVRDEYTAEHLRSIGCGPVVLAADAMFLSDYEAPAAAERTGVAINLKPGALPTESLRSLADAVVSVTQPNEPVVLIPFDRRPEMDSSTLREFDEFLANRRRVVWVGPGEQVDSVLSILSGVRISIGVRLHFSIFSSIAGASLVSLGMEPKARSFAQSVKAVEIDPVEMRSDKVAAQLREARPITDAARADLRRMADAGLSEVVDVLRFAAENGAVRR